MTDQQNLPNGFLLGKYSIQQELGGNENSKLYLALDNQLKIYAIIEELFPQSSVSRNPDGTLTKTNIDNFNIVSNTFNSDTQKMMTLVHPNVSQVVGHFSFNETVYRIFQHPGGETLESILKKTLPGGILADNQVASILPPILDALRTGHSQNILHNNLNPETIFIDRLGNPVLFKFGDTLATQKPGYLAPELKEWQGSVGPWSDIFALGAVLYRCTTGKDPVSAEQRKEEISSGNYDPLKHNLDALASRVPTLAKAIKTSLFLSVKSRAQDAQSFKAILDNTAAPGVADPGLAPVGLQTMAPPPQDPASPQIFDPYAGAPGLNLQKGGSQPQYVVEPPTSGPDAGSPSIDLQKGGSPPQYASEPPTPGPDAGSPSI
ncbi:MAG: hypothetical protein LBF38_07280, partial [Deltaproteobacteria bacterium]|nr:hypothetical protein [Deltaproteobacteria bacterium]